MGMYLNPGNVGFSEVISGEYIDKTGLIELINERINKPNKLSCISRPRRFGKSFTAKMLCSYYDCTCDSHNIFDRFIISDIPGYEDHINKYNVVYFDIAGFLSDYKRKNSDIKNVADGIAEALRTEIISVYPELSSIERVSDCLIKFVEITDKKIVFIIDEWDAIIREAGNDNAAVSAYLNLLREWFKFGNFTDKVVAAAYITGILPIKKDGSQSAISDFREFSILDPMEFALFTGFTEAEVEYLCEKYNMDYPEAKRWYDGYSFPGPISIYNPFSVMMAMERHEFGSYWKQTSAADPLIAYLNINIKKYNGMPSELGADILKLIAGEQLKVNTTRFKNDFQTFTSEDDVLTLLVHLGYLAYDKKTKCVRIPNEEVRMEFNELLEEPQYSKISDLIIQSEKLLNDTLSGDGDAVAEAIRKVRATNYAPMYYNNEQSLRYAIKFAYIICVDRYMKVEELPSGSGLADVVYLPKFDTALPALVVELKWNETADSAIDQIKRNDYPAILADYYGEIMLVGINYDTKTKEHTCKIETIRK